MQLGSCGSRTVTKGKTIVTVIEHWALERKSQEKGRQRKTTNITIPRKGQFKGLKLSQGYTDT